MKPSETKKNIINIVNDYSQEFGITPQFVEKDYYVVEVLSEISKINYPDLKIVFSGGTCLSKAYHKIQRFSEDISSSHIPVRVTDSHFSPNSVPVTFSGDIMLDFGIT